MGPSSSPVCRVPLSRDPGSSIGFRENSPSKVQANRIPGGPSTKESRVSVSPRSPSRRRPIFSLFRGTPRVFETEASLKLITCSLYF